MEHEWLIDLMKDAEDAPLPGMLFRLQLLLESEYVPNPSGIHQRFMEILPPEKIDRFLQMSKRFNAHESYDDITWPAISKLIDNSYLAGHNDFFLDTKGLKDEILMLPGIGCYLAGTPDKELRIQLEGPLIPYSLEGVIHCRASCSGTASYLAAQSASHSSFYFEGEVEGEFAHAAKKCYFELHGRVGDNCAKGAKDCTFSTSNRDTLEQMRKMVPPGNKVTFIDR